jgi:hypothetical protein
MKHLDERFIVNLGVSYHDRTRSTGKASTDEEVIDRLVIHSYNDRLEEKKMTGIYATLFSSISLKET